MSNVSNVKALPLKDVWDCKNIVKMNDGFKCNWCNGFFKGAGANRALAHVSGNKLFGKSGIRFCTGKIPDENKLAYNKLAKGKERHRNYKNNQNEKFNERIQSQNEMLGEELCIKKKESFMKIIWIVCLIYHQTLKVTKK